MAAAEGQAPLSALVLLALGGWTVTYTSWSASDHGNGVTVATSDVTIEITAKEVKRRVEGTDHGKEKPVQQLTQPLDPKTRDEIEALLPKLPDKSARYSISEYVDDEGGSGEALSIERDGKTVGFQLVQGKGPPVPAAVLELKKLIARAQKK